MPLSACPSGVYVFRDVYIRDVFKKNPEVKKCEYRFFLLFAFYFFFLF